MVDLATSFAVGSLATFIPLYLGVFAPNVLVRLWKNPKLLTFLAAASAGIIFWFFLDVMGDAALLDVNQGFTGSVTQTARLTQAVLIILFPVGLGILLALERKFSSKSSRGSQQLVAETGTTSPKFMGFTFAVAAVSALAIGFHALGEGTAIGGSIPSQPTILEAIGGVLPGVAYILHKLLEGLVIGVFAVLAASNSPRKLGYLGLLAGTPTIIGFFLGAWNPFPVDPSKFNPLNITFFFALGGAGALYIELKLVPLITRNRTQYIFVIPLLLGFYSMYLAGLFHG
jgi:hypothetical protein